MDATISGKRGLVALKLEREEGAQLGLSTRKGKQTFEMSALDLVITDLRLGEFRADGTFTFELLELVHPQEIRRKMPSGGLRRVSYGY